MSEKVKSEVEALERSDPKDAQIQFILGQHYFKGTEVHRDYAKALEWYEKAALQGFADAQFKMGQCFLKGLGTEPDLQQAIEWFEKAGRNGHSQAALVLGQMYYKGEDLPKNLYEAKRWLELSRQHEAKALIYEISEELGTIKSTKMIDAEKTTLETLAQMKDPKGLYELGEWYYNGKYIPKDLEKAADYAMDAVTHGSIDAFALLGLIFRERGMIEEELLWLREGVKNRSVDCMYYLGMCYRDGHGVERDLEKACEILYKAYSLQGITGKVPHDKIAGAYNGTYRELHPLTVSDSTEQSSKDKSKDGSKKKKVKKEKPVKEEKEPIWEELLSIAAAALVIGLAVFFVKIGGGKYTDEAVIVLTGFKRLLARVVCIGGIILLSGVSAGIFTLATADEYELGQFIGWALGVVSVVFLGNTPKALIYVICGASVIILLMFIRIIRKRT